MLDGCRKLAVWIHPVHKLLRLEGSVAYYWQGHNFGFTKREFIMAIQHIINILGIDIWKSTLNCFEYGVILDVDMRPKEYITHHAADPSSKLLTNEKGKDKGKYKNFEDKNVKLKMYDAGANIKAKQDRETMRTLQELGWNKDGNFLKWEAHYLKPEYLNKGVGLHLYDLVNPEWENIFKEDLYLQYKRLIPMKGVVMPSSKKELSTADIIMLTMLEENVNEGRTIHELKKMLYAKINAVPDKVLSKSDKDLRKAQIRKILAKIKETGTSIYDLSEQLQKALMLE